MLPLRRPIHIKCRVFINYWTDVEEVDNLLAPWGSPCPPECPDSWGKSSKISRYSPANQTIILAVNQVVCSLCDTSKTSSEPLLLAVLLTLLCYVPAACWPFERISGRCERSKLVGSAFVVCVLAAAGRGSWVRRAPRYWNNCWCWKGEGATNGTSFHLNAPPTLLSRRFKCSFLVSIFKLMWKWGSFNYNFNYKMLLLSLFAF